MRGWWLIFLIKKFPFSIIINDQFRTGGQYTVQTDLATLRETVGPGCSPTHWPTWSLNVGSPWSCHQVCLAPMWINLGKTLVFCITLCTFQSISMCTYTILFSQSPPLKSKGFPFLQSRILRHGEVKGSLTWVNSIVQILITSLVLWFNNFWF